MKLSIVIPVHNNWHFTKACLKDLSQLPDDHEIVLVDNGSTDDTKAPTKYIDSLSQGSHPRFHIIRFNHNFGFAKACNQGYARAEGEYVMFLNNDIRVQKDHATWTSPVIEAAKEGLVGPTGGLLDVNLNFLKEEDKLIDSNHFYMSGWNLTASRDTWNKLKINDYQGPWTEEFGTYFEDTDLSFRAKELGIPFKILPVPVMHFGRMTGKQLGLPQLYAAAHTKFINKWIGRI